MARFFLQIGGRRWPPTQPPQMAAQRLKTIGPIQTDAAGQYIARDREASPL